MVGSHLCLAACLGPSTWSMWLLAWAADLWKFLVRTGNQRLLASLQIHLVYISHLKPEGSQPWFTPSLLHLMSISAHYWIIFKSVERDKRIDNYSDYRESNERFIRTNLRLLWVCKIRGEHASPACRRHWESPRKFSVDEYKEINLTNKKSWLHYLTGGKTCSW